MVVGERLAELLKARGMTRDALALAVGVKQPTITRLITGGQYGSTKLHLIARELGTTPAYLSGETDDPDEDALPIATLSSDERKLLDCFGALAPAERKALLTIAQAMAGRTPPGMLHAPTQDYRPPAGV